MVGGDDPLYLKFWAKLTMFLKNADFHLIFAYSTNRNKMLSYRRETALQGAL